MRWALVMFDLPTDTKRARKATLAVHVGRVERSRLPDGEVLIVELTDKQCERMRIIWGNHREQMEAPPCQLELL